MEDERRKLRKYEARISKHEYQSTKLGEAKFNESKYETRK